MDTCACGSRPMSHGTCKWNTTWRDETRLVTMVPLVESMARLTTHVFSVSLSLSYWTENHMILYLSATILLRDRINLDPTDDAVIHIDVRLRHYLNTKIKYGFYEWFSTLYL
jgi:hypothetical protein